MMKRKGMFGAVQSIMPGDQPDYGMGGFRIPVDGGPDMPEAAQPEAKKPSFFGQGGIGRNIAGYVGDWLQQVNGGEATFAPAMQLRQQMAYQQQRAQQQRETEWQDYVRKAEYDRANPKPINNDTVADYNFWKSVLSPEDFQKWQQNKIDPPQYRQGPDGQFYRINPSQQTPPAFSADDWNSGTPIKGGSGGNAGGGFR